MASSDILSQTLSSITAIKLEELSFQRSNFEDGKAKLLSAVADESNQRDKVSILLDRVEGLASMGKLNDNPLISLKNVKQFLEQARTDPSVSDKLQKGWQTKLEQELDIHSSKYEYASLYGQLVKEWLSVSDDAGDASSNDGSAFEKVGRKEMHDQRAKWEEYVFKSRETDPADIQTYLQKLFSATKPIRSGYSTLCRSTETFESEMANSSHFNDFSLTWVIKGLLRSDLVTDEKRKVLKDFLNNKVVLAEVADVLNMRMKSLDKWHWGPEGTSVEQRRQLNGRYRFYHDEDLLKSILLRYIGVKWSVHFKTQFGIFRSGSDVWKSSSASIPASERKRRENFLGRVASYCPASVESERASLFDEDIFLEQLQTRHEENRAGYDDDCEEEADTSKSSQQITQSVLHTLATEIIMKTRLGEDVCAVRSDFAWFGPSLPHSTIFAVLKFFNVSSPWVSFFRRVLEAPMRFLEDGPNAPVQIRKRGTPISGPLSDMLGETVLFCLDFAFNSRTDGALLYRLHDDIWFWGPEKTCVAGWGVMTDFAALMGLDFNQDKTGSVRVTREKKTKALPSSLPKGDVHWGFLKLDGATGRFLIDQDNVDTHIEELRHQLAACKSVFDWIQAWNIYGARFFTTNFGRPAHCFGRAHVDMMLKTFSRIQSKLFKATGGSVTSTLKKMITERFGVEDIPEGYLYFPMAMGGLDLKSPFVSLYLIRNTIASNTDAYMDTFFDREEAAYRQAKVKFDKDQVPGRSSTTFNLRDHFAGESFMSMEDFTRYREQTSPDLGTAYKSMMQQPIEDEVVQTSDVCSALDRVALTSGNDRGGRGGHPGDTRQSVAWVELTPYQRWIIQLYAPDMIARFGGLNVVEKGLLPTGMVSMFRESRFKWQG